MLEILRAGRRRFLDFRDAFELKAYLSEKDLSFSNVQRLHLILGTQCNYRCTMCYQKEFAAKMNPAIWRERLLPLYPQLSEVCLQGGEPTAVPQYREFVDFLVEVNPRIKIGMFTNGYLFDDYWVSRFVRHGSWLNISLNAATKDTYDVVCKKDAWNTVISNVKKLLMARANENGALKVAASFVILKENTWFRDRNERRMAKFRYITVGCG